MCRGDGGLTMSSPPLNIYLSFLLIYYKSRLKKQQPYVLNLRKINTYYVYIKNAINSQISKNIIRGFRIRFPDGFFTCRYYVNSQVCNWVFLEEGVQTPHDPRLMALFITAFVGSERLLRLWIRDYKGLLRNSKARISMEQTLH